MSNGVNGLFLFVEQGTDPREGVGFDAPLNSLCSFDGVFLQKTGDAATAWTEFGGGGFSGGTVPDATTFESDVTFEGDAFFMGVITTPDELTLSAGAGVLVSTSLTVNGVGIFNDTVAINGGNNLVMNGGGNVVAAGGQFGSDPLSTAGEFRHTGAGVGFYSTTATAQPAAIPDATGGGTVDAECRAATNAALAALRLLGLIDT